jgi:hypothetical protein
MTVVDRGSRRIGYVASFAALAASLAGCSTFGPASASTQDPQARRHGYCTPPIPVVPEAFPTPADSTPAAAAMARAQADHDAAVRNAAQNAAYAACMASDSA